MVDIENDPPHPLPSSSERPLQVRAAHESAVPSRILENLGDGECMTTADWKMKFMAFQFREAQTNFFGKRGIPWHGIMIAYKVGEELRVEFIDAIVRDSDEDAVSTFQQLIAGWSSFLLRHPGRNKTRLRSDGASCYSGGLFCKLLGFAWSLCGMQVIEHLIGEGGKNKTTLDGHFGQRGSMARTEVVKGKGAKDAVDAESLVAVLAGDRSKAPYTQMTTPNRSSFSVGGDDIKGISHISQRVYEYDEDGSLLHVRLRQQTDLGDGRVILASDLLGKTEASDIPVALEHTVEDEVGAPHNTLLTKGQKDAETEAAASKRELASERKDGIVQNSRAERAKLATVERAKKGRFFCSDAVGGNKFCNRNFKHVSALAKHLEAGNHSGGVFRPWAISTTKSGPDTEGGGQTGTKLMKKGDPAQHAEAALVGRVHFSRRSEHRTPVFRTPLSRCSWGVGRVRRSAWS